MWGDENLRLMVRSGAGHRYTPFVVTMYNHFISHGGGKYICEVCAFVCTEQSKVMPKWKLVNMKAAK